MSNMPAEMSSEQEIRWKLSVDARDMLEAISTTSTAISQIKANLKDLSNQSQADLKVIADVMSETFEKARLAKVPKVETEAGNLAPDPEELKKAKADIEQYNADLRKAVSAQVSEERSLRSAANKDISEQTKIRTQQELAAAQQEVNIKRQVIAQKTALEQEYNKKVVEMQLQQAREQAKAERKEGRAGISDPKQLAGTARQQATVASSQYSDALVAEQKAISNVVVASQKYAVTLSASDKATLDAANASKVLATQTANTAKVISSDAEKEASKLEAAAGRMKGAFSLVKMTLASAFGISIVGIFRDISQSFQDLINDGLEFANSLFKLGASVRALQAQGLDVTLKGTLEQIKQLRQQFGIFSTKDLVEGVAQIQLLTRNFNFTQKEMQQMLEITSSLSVVLGKDFNSSAQSLALFLSSGYGEALQRAGLAVNRLTVVQEANRMGIEKSYMAMTEVERSHAALSLAYKQSKDMISEVNKRQESYIGQLEKTKAATEDYKNALALGLIPAEKAWLEIKSTGIYWLIEGINLLVRVTGFAITQMLKAYAMGAAMMSNLSIAIDNLKNKLKGDFSSKELMSASDIHAMVQSIDEQMKKGIEDAQIQNFDLDKLLNFTGGDNPVKPKLPGIEDADYDRQLKIMNDLNEALLQVQKDYENDSKKLLEDYENDKKKIQEKADADSLKAEEEYQKKLADIQKDYDKSVADAYKTAQRAREDLARDTANRIADANRKYHEDQVKAERDFQERMKKLREEFLFDLEDALRERDALQVLRLIRRYQLDKEQAARENQNNIDDLRQQHQDELEEIRRSEAEKSAEIARNLQDQLQAARDAAEEKRADAKAAYDEELAQLEESTQKEQDALNAKYQEENKALEEGLAAKVQAVIESWAKLNDIVPKDVKLIKDVLNETFGSQGITQGIFDLFTKQVDKVVADLEAKNARLEKIVADAMMMKAQVDQALRDAENATSPGTPSSGQGSASHWNPATHHAAGGTHIATSPSYATYGEAGPELAMFTPLNRIGDIPKQLASVGLSGGTESGNVSVRVWLSPGLEAEIMDSTLDAVAGIFKENR